MKYSIMIPVKNALKYLPDAIDSIVSQNYSDYELIISDDNSDDGTAEYIDTLKIPNSIILHTPYEMFVNEHFDWVQQHASGDWQMFLGADDALQSYFFDLAGKLTDYAQKNNIRTIGSQRSYFFWPGCEKTYGDIYTAYNYDDKIEIRSSEKYIKKCLNGYAYHFCPTMYTTSLFRKDFINEVRERQHGDFILTRITDSYLSALGLIYNKKFLYSGISLSWVGSSPKTVNRPVNEKKKLQIPERFGPYDYGSISIYFWMSLLEAEKHKTDSKKYETKHFLYSLFVSEFLRTPKKDILKQIVVRNACSWNIVILCVWIKKNTHIIKKLLLAIPVKFYRFVVRCINYVKRHLSRLGANTNTETKSFEIRVSPCSYLNLRERVYEIYRNSKVI